MSHMMASIDEHHHPDAELVHVPMMMMGAPDIPLSLTIATHRRLSPHSIYDYSFEPAVHACVCVHLYTSLAHIVCA